MQATNFVICSQFSMKPACPESVILNPRKAREPAGNPDWEEQATETSENEVN
jgi:hypothetical protein